MSTLLKLGLSGYDVKPRFCAFQCKYLLQNPLFLWGKKWMALDTSANKMNPLSIVFFGGGVHGKVCWLIAYCLILYVSPGTCYRLTSQTYLRGFLHPEIDFLNIILN